MDVFDISKEGFHPFLIQKNWQIALLNYMPQQSYQNINKVEIHKNTDEIFVLLEGKAILITAEFNKATSIAFKYIIMESKKVYNIKKKCWHNIAMQENSKVLIIENSNTHLDDVEYFMLSDDQKKEITKNCLNLT